MKGGGASGKRMAIAMDEHDSSGDLCRHHHVVVGGQHAR